jgi:heme/copper-type cytochrome/quinol oxidase subunit 3
VLLFIFSEVVFFGSLILSYVYYRASVPDVASQSRQLDVPLTAVFSLFLFSSSFTIWRADRALAGGRYNAFLAWLGATIALGLVFLVGQGLEYARLFEENTTASSSLFGSAFFTLTGFHGFHVLGGLVALSILLGLGIRGVFRGGRTAAPEAVSLYWHFVDAVWVFLLAVIYLWPLVG